MVFMNCACCGFPAIGETGLVRCIICFWRGDALYSKDPLTVVKGVNGEVSLAEAKENFERDHTYLRPTDEPGYSEERKRWLSKKTFLSLTRPNRWAHKTFFTKAQAQAWIDLQADMRKFDYCFSHRFDDLTELKSVYLEAYISEVEAAVLALNYL